MASIQKAIVVDADPESAWDAVRDFGAVHSRLAAGFVVATQVEGDDRLVTFANGVVQREPLVDVNEERRRLVYSTQDSPLGATHYNASLQVLDREGRTTLEWTVDFLPNSLASVLDRAMTAGAEAIQRTLSKP